MKAIIKDLVNFKNITIIFILLAIIAGVQSYMQTAVHYNNYVIFRQSFFHLINGMDLYKYHLGEGWDYYKYSPTFALFFGLFAIFPDVVGISLWNIANVLVFVLAIYYLPQLTNKKKSLILIICLIEMLTSIQSQQSNGMMAGLIILAFGLMERKKFIPAAFCIVFSAFIKINGVVGLALFLFYPEKWKNALYTLGWTLVLFALPLLAVSFAQLKFLYSSWIFWLNYDHSISFGYSILGILNTWFGMVNYKLIAVITGAIIFLIPFVRLKQYGNYTFRMLALTSVLMWMVLFNHKGESPSYIIPIAGVAIWFIISEKTILNICLLVFAFILTCLSPTDLFPRYIHDNYVHTYSLMALPCALIWFKIVYEMIVLKKDDSNYLTNN
jgi:hypothetical protein